jgi:hypothetical protein
LLAERTAAATTACQPNDSSKQPPTLKQMMSHQLASTLSPAHADAKQSGRTGSEKSFIEAANGKWQADYGASTPQNAAHGTQNKQQTPHNDTQKERQKERGQSPQRVTHGS